jgi:hypothetical protein
LDKD